MSNKIKKDKNKSKDDLPRFHVFDVSNHLQSRIYLEIPPKDTTKEPNWPNNAEDMSKIFHVSKITTSFDEEDEDENDPKKTSVRITHFENVKKNNDSNSITGNTPPPRYTIEMSHPQYPFKKTSNEGIAVRNRYPKAPKDMTRNIKDSNAWSVNDGVPFRRPTKNSQKVNRTPTKAQSGCCHASVVELHETLKQYCYNSTIHGLKYVGDSSLSTLERLFWIISFTVAATLAAFFIWNLYAKYTLAPMIISRSPDPAALTDFPFPSITICNMNNAQRLPAMRIKTSGNALDKWLLEDMCDFNTSSTGDVVSAHWDYLRSFMINVTQPCDELLYFCRWHGFEKNCSELFSTILTDEGLCCNFNAVPPDLLFYDPRELNDQDEDDIAPYRRIDWNPETEYNKDTPADAIPWRAYGSGVRHGLSLTLDVNVDEYYCSSTASVGIKMLLHNPVETPKIRNFAIALAPGKETRIIINPQIDEADLSLISIPIKKRKCYFLSERKLRYYRTYTQRNCFLECEANFTRYLCNCVQYYMPGTSKSTICGKEDDICTDNARKAMENQLFDDEDGLSKKNLSKIQGCSCYPGCFEINYSTETSQSTMLSSFDVDEEYVKNNPEYFVKNIAVVHVFYVGSQFVKYRKSQLYGFSELLSNTGGLLGLFMGISLLSVMEIIYFFILRLGWRMCSRRNNVDNKNRLFHVQPTPGVFQNVYPFTQ